MLFEALVQPGRVAPLDVTTLVANHRHVLVQHQILRPRIIAEERDGLRAMEIEYVEQGSRFMPDMTTKRTHVAKRQWNSCASRRMVHRDERHKPAFTPQSSDANLAPERTRLGVRRRAEQGVVEVRRRPLQDSPNKGVDTTGNETDWVARIDKSRSCSRVRSTPTMRLVLAKPRIGRTQALFKGDARLPAKALEPRRVEQLSRCPIRLRRVELDRPVEAN